MDKENTMEKKILEKRHDFLLEKSVFLHELVAGLTTAEAIAILELEKAWLVEKAMGKMRDFKPKKE